VYAYRSIISHELVTVLTLNRQKYMHADCPIWVHVQCACLVTLQG